MSARFHYHFEKAKRPKIMNIFNNAAALGVCAHVLGALALCISRNLTARRRYVEAMAFLAAVLSLHNAGSFSPMYDVNYSWAFYMSNFIFHLNSLLNIYCYTPPQGMALSGRFRLAFRQTINPRGLGMKWQHRGGRTASRYMTKAPYLRRQCVLVILAFSIISLWDNGFYCPLFLRREDLAPGKETWFRRLSSVTTRELLVRVFITFSSQVDDYFTLLFIHSVISIVGLLCGDEPEEWPPMFGSLTEAYTLRGYWT